MNNTTGGMDMIALELEKVVKTAGIQSGGLYDIF